MPDTLHLRESRSRKAAGAVGVALAAVLVLCGACGSETADAKKSRASEPVCGFFSKAAVTKVVGSSSFSVDGTGMISEAERRTETANCVVVDTDAPNPPIAAVVAELSKRRTSEQVRATLEREAAKNGCQGSRTWADLGTGNLCRSGNTTSIAVLTPERLVRVELTGRTGSDRPDPDTALSLAREADAAATAYDAAHP